MAFPRIVVEDAIDELLRAEASQEWRVGKSRVLHFKDADSALAYRSEFGYGNTVSGIFSHLRRSARLAATAALTRSRVASGPISGSMRVRKR